jgi:hypothetical protein
MPWDFTDWRVRARARHVHAKSGEATVGFPSLICLSVEKRWDERELPLQGT